MATTSSPIAAPTLQTRLIERVKPFLVPYYLAVIATLGLVTVIFVVVTSLIVLVAANFNPLGWTE